jgi:hypothetical protein
MPRPSGLISHRSQHQSIASSCHLREFYFLDKYPFTTLSSTRPLPLRSAGLNILRGPNSRSASSHGAANPAYAMCCQQRALPASVSHAVPASANAQEIRFGKCLSHGARRSRRYSKRVSCAFSACSLLSCFSRRAEDRRVLRGHPGRQGPRALQDRKALAERRASSDHLDQQDRRARRGSRVLRVRKECAAKADRRDQQARRATRDRQDPRAIAAKQGHPAHPAPQPQPRCAASIPTATASPARKTKSWSPRSARTPAVRLSSREQRCGARDQRESSASACASRNSRIE